MKIRIKRSLILYFLFHFYRETDLFYSILTIIALSFSISTMFLESKYSPIIALIALIINISLRVKAMFGLAKPSSEDLKLKTKDMTDFGNNKVINLPVYNYSKPSAKHLKDLTLSFNRYGFFSMSETINHHLLDSPSLPVKVNKKFERNLLDVYKFYRNDFRDFLVEKAKGEKSFFNEKKIALLTSLNGDKNQEIHLGKTSYFSSIITNEASSYVVERRDKIISDLTILNPLTFDKESPTIVKSLEESGLSNHIGVSMLVMSTDNHLILWNQNKNAQHSENKLVPTSSGSLDYKDIYKSKAIKENDFLTIIKYGMARELWEEAGLSKTVKKRYSKKKKFISEIEANILIVGYFRLMNRGGKPEFIGIAKIDTPYYDFLPDEKEVEKIDAGGKLISDFPITSASDIINFHNYLQNQKTRKVSLQLSLISVRLKEIIESKEKDLLINLLGITDDLV